MKIERALLRNGKNEFVWKSPPGFDGSPDGLNLEDGIQTDVIAELGERELIVNLRLQAKVLLACSRCLRDFAYSLRSETCVVYTWKDMPEQWDEEETSVFAIHPEQKEIDLKDHVMESLILEIPMKPVCREDCKGLCLRCGSDRNVQPCHCTQPVADSRWNRLRDFVQS